ncbi:MAG: hypothetical protein CL675_02000 [Bdellovibrionaceae bacterium]|nr:hypothetical protein [Pseudobdellovibrionaceae bacterium]
METEHIDQNPAADRMTLLCVDNNQEVLDMVQVLLKKSFDVITESSSSKALSVAKHTRPDVILLDLNMPHISGSEILRTLKEDPTTELIPTIFLTAERGLDWQKHLHDQGAVGYIQKPINPKTFLNDLEQIVINLNLTVSSSDGLKKSFIGFSKEQKYRQLEDETSAILDTGKPVIIISADNGDTFFQNAPSLYDALLSNQLRYLRVKSTLILRLPHLDDTRPLKAELERLAEGNLKEFHVVIDEPTALFDQQRIKLSTAPAQTLRDLIHGHFGSAYFYFLRGKDSASQNLTSELASIMTD